MLKIKKKKKKKKRHKCRISRDNCENWASSNLTGFGIYTYIPSVPFEFQNDFPQVEFSQVPGEFRRVSDFHARLRFLEVAERRRPPHRPRILFPFLKLARSCALAARCTQPADAFYFPFISLSWSPSIRGPFRDEYVYDDGKVGPFKGSLCLCLESIRAQIQAIIQPRYTANSHVFPSRFTP